MTHKLDKKFISYALNLAKKNLGLTAPNPVVGCVIVKDNKILSSGVTSKGGRPHAEEIAINKILEKENGRDLLKDSTIYVTLEPCSHFGETAPCVNKIIDIQVARVVIATQDPDTRVNGKGIKILQENGIEVNCGIMKNEAQQLNKGFFKAKNSGLPYITLKLATSLDGKIATKDSHSKWITSQKARDFAHYLRAINDAIMIGANTLRKDDPMLDCRINGLEEYSPTRIIISKNAEFDKNLKIFNSADKIPTLLITSNIDANFANCTKIIEDSKDKINLESALRNIAQTGINSVLVEGGSNLATQLLQENLIDEIIWIRNKKIIGNDGLCAIGDMNFSNIDQTINSFNKDRVIELKEDIIEFYS